MNLQTCRAIGAELATVGAEAMRTWGPRAAQVIRTNPVAAVLVLAMLVVFAPTRGELQAGAENNAIANAAPHEADYRLGPQDKVRIQVYEWRPARDEIFAWEALNAEYIVDTSGRLALPLIGQVPASGMTTGELASKISMRLMRRMGTATAPDTTVAITEFRPVYVTGAIETPGAYPYQPSLTVLQAVSIGGGLQRAVRGEGNEAIRQYFEQSGQLALLDQERVSLLVLQARLQAELTDAKHVDLPSSMTSRAVSPMVKQTLLNANLLFDTRQATFRKQMAAIDRLKAHLTAETTSLKSQVKTHNRQVALLQKELSGIKSLSGKGLVTAPRLLGLQRNLAQLEGEALRLEARQSQIQQDLTRNEVTRQDIENRRSEDLTQGLQKAAVDLDNLRQREATAKQLMGHAQSIAAADGAMLALTKDREITYTIVRKFSDRFMEFAAVENTTLMPGDTLKVALGKADTSLPTAPTSEGFYGSSFAPSGVPSAAPAPSPAVLPAPEASATDSIVPLPEKSPTRDGTARPARDAMLDPALRRPTWLATPATDAGSTAQIPHRATPVQSPMVPTDQSGAAVSPFQSTPQALTSSKPFDLTQVDRPQQR